jgi:WD40 repeat protein
VTSFEDAVVSNTDIDVDEDDMEEGEDNYENPDENGINSTVVSRTYGKQAGASPPNSTESSSDLETEDALKEFSFLNSEMSNGGGTHVNDDWKMDKNALIKMTEDYKKDRKKFKQNESLQNIHRPNRATLQAMINTLNDDSIDSRQMLEQEQQQQNIKKMSFLDDESMETMMNLGELSRISVSNNDDTLMDGSFDETLGSNAIQAQSRKHTLTNRFILRGHFDSVRCLAFHPTTGILVSGSEDQTMKLWNLDSKNLLNSKRTSTNNDIESYYTYRGHSSPILSVLFTQDGQNLVTSSADGSIKLWLLPPCEETDPYDSYDPNILVKTLYSHTDAVWQLLLHENLLVSSSADGTIRIWNPFTSDDDNKVVLSQSNMFYDKSVHNEGGPHFQTILLKN